MNFPGVRTLPDNWLKLIYLFSRLFLQDHPANLLFELDHQYFLLFFDLLIGSTNHSPFNFHEDYQFHKHLWMIHQLLTIFGNSYLGNYGTLKNGLPLIFYLLDIEKTFFHFYFHFLHLWWKLFMLNI